MDISKKYCPIVTNSNLEDAFLKVYSYYTEFNLECQRTSTMYRDGCPASFTHFFSMFELKTATTYR